MFYCIWWGLLSTAVSLPVWRISPFLTKFDTCWWSRCITELTLFLPSRMVLSYSTTVFDGKWGGRMPLLQRVVADGFQQSVQELLSWPDLLRKDFIRPWSIAVWRGNFAVLMQRLSLLLLRWAVLLKYSSCHFIPESGQELLHGGV